MSFLKIFRKTILLTVLVIIMLPLKIFPQDLGMSFSFFFPRNGYFSTPISPFSIRGLSINPTRYFSFETGFSLYRMSGMNVTGLPFESKDPLMGPMFSLFVPVTGVLEAQAKNIAFRVKGGGFGFYNLDNRINYGNLDHNLADYYGWSVANADFSFDNKIGFGYLIGGEIIIYFTRQFGMNFEVNYLSGGSDVNFRGLIAGANTSGLDMRDVSYTDSRLDFTGWEITIGLLFSNKR